MSPAAEYQTSSPVEFAITVQNLGPDSAREVRLYNYSGYLFEGLEGVTVTPSAGTCAFEVITATSPPRYFVCDIPELAVGQSLVTTVRGTATLVGQFPIEMRTTLRAFDPDNANNAPRSTYTITQAITAAATATDKR